MITHEEAQKAIYLLTDYVRQQQELIGSLKTDNTVTLPDGFSLDDMVLDVRSRNVLKEYYRFEKGRGLLNTSARGILRSRNSGKKTLAAIEKEFNRHGIKLSI